MLPNKLKGFYLEKNISLSRFTTLRVGGQAEWLAEPTNIDEIEKLLFWANNKKLPCQIIGAGSNLLIADAGIKGLSVCLRKFQGSKINAVTGIVEAAGGEPIPALARKTAKAGLHGLEWAVGIPGTAGGAAVMNAGAQGGSFAEIVKSIKVLPLIGGSPFEIKVEDLKYDYRFSLLQKEKLIVLSTQFQLQTGHDPSQITKVTNNNLVHRTTTQPYHQPSCGSVFRNPEPFKAGQLIEELGLKGHKIGGAEISKIHANFIVNTGNASAKDISNLIEFIQEKVQTEHGLLLEPEVKKLGFYPIN